MLFLKYSNLLDFILYIIQVSFWHHVVITNPSISIIVFQIGIIGRTGAGKSSIISSLFRLFNVEGSISIDGIDTATVGLHDLRTRVTIIPQEPILFSGTVRFNLDPFSEFADDKLFTALQEVNILTAWCRPGRGRTSAYGPSFFTSLVSHVTPFYLCKGKTHSWQRKKLFTELIAVNNKNWSKAQCFLY